MTKSFHTQKKPDRKEAQIKPALMQKDQADILEGYRWEFNLVEDPSANAFAMPGGKVVIFSSILSITKSESGLATVMGHEIGHAVARHGKEHLPAALKYYRQ